MLALALILCVKPSFADVVETKSGARIVGKVVAIDGGTVSVDTNFAGTIAVKQSEVTAITTDAPVAVRLASGTTSMAGFRPRMAPSRSPAPMAR